MTQFKSDRSGSGLEKTHPTLVSTTRKFRELLMLRTQTWSSSVEGGMKPP